jgi:hypothetical protein
MDLAGGPIWSNGTFYAGAGAVIGLLSIVAIVWVTIRVARPKRRLLVALTATTPILAHRPGLPQLRVMYGDGQMKAPYTATVRLESRGGRLDIPRTAFDDGEPLRLDLGTDFLEILEVTTGNGDMVPAVSAEPGSPVSITVGGEPIRGPVPRGLLIGPSLIKWNQRIEISVLTDGKPELGKLHQQLENVEIAQFNPDYIGGYTMLGKVIFIASATVTGVIAVSAISIGIIEAIIHH